MRPVTLHFNLKSLPRDTQKLLMLLILSRKVLDNSGSSGKYILRDILDLKTCGLKNKTSFDVGKPVNEVL